MALQIKGKFVENAAIDGDKVELKVGQALKQKKADGTTVEVIKVVEESGQVVVKANDQEIAFKSQVDGLSTQVATQTQALIAAETAARIADVNAEEARALAAEGVLQSNIDAEQAARLADVSALDARLDIIEGAATVEGSVAKAEQDAKDYADAAVLAEETRALAAEAALSADITAGDTATLTAAKDYVERLLGVSDSTSISALANLQTWLQDNDEATGVITALAAVEARVDTTEGGLSSLNGRVGSLETRMTTAESDINAVEAALAQELLDRAAGDASTLASANSYTDTEVGVEETRALAAEAALAADIASEETRAVTAEAALQAEDLTFLKLDGTRAMTGDLNMGQNKIQASKPLAAPAMPGSEDRLTIETDPSKNILLESYWISSPTLNYSDIVKIGASQGVRVSYKENSTEYNYSWMTAGVIETKMVDISTGNVTSLNYIGSQTSFQYRDSTTGLTVSELFVDSSGTQIKGSASITAADGSAFTPSANEHLVTKKYVDDAVSAEESARIAADAAIQAEVDALDVRVDALEAVAHYKEKFVMPSTVPAFIELEREAKFNSIVASVGRLMIHQGEGEDFTVSVVAGKTRITFVGNLISPSPEQLGEGDVIYVKYMA